MIYNWLVVWNHGILWLSIQLGMSSSQLPFTHIFPHIFVWGSCFWLCTSACLPPPRPAAHTQLVLHTQLVHTQLAHTQLTHTPPTHTQLVTTHNLSPHNLLTHNLLTHNLSPHNLLTHTTCSHTTYSTYSHTTCPHTTYSHTTSSTVTLHGRRGTWWHRPSLCVAGVALMALDWLWWRAWVLWSPRLFAWQAWHLATSTFTLHAGMALGDIDLHVTSTFTLRGRHGPYGTGLALAAVCVAGMELGDIDLHFAWQAWHLWHWAGSGGALGESPRLFAWQAWPLATSTFTLRGRRGTWWHQPSLCGRGGTWRHRRAFCMAGVALLALHWLWRAWVLWSPRLFAWQALHLATSTFTLRGRRGTWWHQPSLCGRGGTWRHRRAFCMVGVALLALHWLWRAWVLWSPRLFAWQALHLATSTFTLRGRRGTWWHQPSICGRGGTWRHRRAFCMVGVALLALHWLRWRAWVLWSPRLFAWQAWHLATSTFTLHGRRGTYGTGLALVAHKTLPHNFVTDSFHTQLCQTSLSHTTLSHPTLSHTTLSHTNLSHTTLSHTTLSHTSLSHAIFYTQLCHIQLFHTQHFYIHKLTHTTLSHTALSPNLSCTISFPSCLSHLIFTSACDRWKKLICGVIRSFISIGSYMDHDWCRFHLSESGLS